MTPTAHRIKVVKGKKISTMIVEGNGKTIKEKQVFIVTLKNEIILERIDQNEAKPTIGGNDQGLRRTGPIRS